MKVEVQVKVFHGWGTLTPLAGHVGTVLPITLKMYEVNMIFLELHVVCYKHVLFSTPACIILYFYVFRMCIYRVVYI